MKLIRFCILPLALSFTVFAQKKPSYTPDQATARMTLPEGFSVTQFAAEPAVVQPFAFCFDDRGRVWVCENLNYATRKSDTFKAGPQGRIIILEDGRIAEEGSHQELLDGRGLYKRLYDLQALA